LFRFFLSTPVLKSSCQGIHCTLHCNDHATKLISKLINNSHLQNETYRDKALCVLCHLTMLHCSTYTSRASVC
jgi:hypothetical protein